MKPEESIGRIKKYNMFSQNEAIDLTGFSRQQLIKWDEADIVKPYRHPCILYDWNQIIMLKILFYWRVKASYQKIVRIFDEENIDLFFQQLEKSSLAFLNNEKLIFVNDTFHKDYVLFSKIIKALDEMNIESLDYSELMPGLIMLNISAIISNLKKEGELLKIENFDLKVG